MNPPPPDRDPVDRVLVALVFAALLYARIRAAFRALHTMPGQKAGKRQ